MQRTDTVPLDEQLIQALHKLAPPRAPNGKDRTDRAALAALRRGLGQTPGAVPEMFRHLRELAEVRPDRENDAFLVASLFAWHPLEWSSAEHDRERSRARWTQNFGNSLARLVVELRKQRIRSSSATSTPPAAAAEAESEERPMSPPPKQPRPQPGIERRFVTLLAADREDVDHHLQAAVGLLRQHDVPVNWLQLLRDLGGWEHPDRDVQRRWARSFWGSANPEQ